MKVFFLGLATIAVIGCSGPAIVPPTELTFRSETVAVGRKDCRNQNVRHSEIATTTAQTMFVGSGAGVIDESRWTSRSRYVEPRTLNASVCAALIKNGNEPYGLAGYSEISVAQVVIRITDASGAIRYFGEGRVEYRTSGRQNFVCGLREIRRTGGVTWKRDGLHGVINLDIRPCPSSPEQAIQFAAADAFNSLKKY